MEIKKDTFTVLSLFDGGSGGQLAFKDLGIEFDGAKYKYFASEIKGHAIKLTKHHFPNTIHIGDVTKVSYKDGILYTENGEYEVGHIDLLIGGSPCQDFSQLNTLPQCRDKEGFGLEGNKSKLFYEYLRIKNEINPTYFFLENVKMKKESENELNDYLNCKGLHACSSLVSFQTRGRIYWSNANLEAPAGQNVNFQDFKDTDYEYCKQFKLNKTKSRIKMWNNGEKGLLGTCKNVTNSQTITAVTRKQDRAPNSGLVEFEDFCRFLTRRELELAQTMPVGYTDILSYNQAQDIIGDGWTIKMISHFFKQIIEELNSKN